MDGDGTELDRPRWREALGDWGPVLLVGALSMTGLALEQPWTGTDLELAATSLATALPLAWRRRAPLAVAATVAGVLLLHSLALGQALHFGSFLGSMVAVYSVARHLTVRAAALGLAVVLVAMLAAQAGAVADDPGQLVYPLVYFGGVWLLGRGARRLAVQGARLRELNSVLERDRESRAALAVAEERLRLARELHDTLGHRLVLMVVQAQAAQQTLERDPAATRASLEAVRRTGQEGMQELRQLVDALHRDPAEDDLERLAERTRAAGLDVRLETDEVPPEVGPLVHRVVQESLTNVLKHSAAARVDVSVRAARDTGGVEVVVSDPGPRRSGSSDGGHGLRGLRQRLEERGGSVTARPHGEGFRVHVRMPGTRATEAPS